ncbi:MAG: zinc ribbon domain-containing protein [Planctomycetota bacterium]|jgi:hypothetical protein
MPTQYCTCGAKYRFPDSALGRRVKCKKCGVVFKLTGKEDDGTIPIADEGLMGEMATAAERFTAAPASPRDSASSGQFGPGGSTMHLPSLESFGGHGDVVVDRAVAPSGYLRDLYTTLLFPAGLGNLVTFMFVWGMLFFSSAVLSFAGPIGLIGQFIILGWYCAYRFSVIAQAASGEPDLPALTLSEGSFEGIVLAILRWLGSWIVVLLPAYICMVVMLYLGISRGLTPMVLLSGGVAAAAQNADVFAVALLMFASILAWPMVVLCVALGGFASLVRVDLIVVTLFKTLPMYILTAMFVFGAKLLGTYLAFKLPQSYTSGIAVYFMGHLMVAGVGLYFEIVALRVIGLYYHHFKHRFAWDWG